MNTETTIHEPPRTADAQWHRLEVDDVLEAFGSSRQGLSSAAAADRLSRGGPNRLEGRGAKNPLRILWEQLTAVMVVVLIAASLLSLALGKLLEIAKARRRAQRPREELLESGSNLQGLPRRRCEECGIMPELPDWVEL